jgi:hypothetical protein
MMEKNKKMPVSGIKGQGNAYIYNILHDINKLKILLVFMHKGFTWHRELKSFGIYNNIIEETLNEFNSLGFIELKELVELDDIQYETLKGVKYDLQHYFKIYFTNPRIYEVLDDFNDDLEFLMQRNPQLIEFVGMVKRKLQPFMLKTQQILKEEETQFVRKVTMNGVTFLKDTKMSKEVKKILQLTSSKQGTDLVLKEIKPLALMTPEERKKHTNKVILNGKEVSPSVIREIDEYDKQITHEIENGTDLVKRKDGKGYAVLDQEKLEEFKEKNKQLTNKKMADAFLGEDNEEEALDFLNGLKGV